MISSQNNFQQNSRLLSILFLVTFSIHMSWIAYVSIFESLKFVENLQIFFTQMYSHLAFEWNGNAAYVITAGLISSVFINVIRRFLEGFFLGWPRFKEHNKNSFIRASILLLSYGSIIFFTIGFFGEKYSSRPLDFFNIFFIAVFTYFVGLLIDFIDEVISATYCMFFGATL